MMMMKRLTSKRLFKRSSKLAVGGGVSHEYGGGGDIEWEMRPGGMLVQKRGGGGGGVITVRVISTGFYQHDISIGATATFGDLKMDLAAATGLEPERQRLLFKGKERDDGDHLHMVGVSDKDKVLLYVGGPCMLSQR